MLEEIVSFQPASERYECVRFLIETSTDRETTEALRKETRKEACLEEATTRIAHIREALGKGDDEELLVRLWVEWYNVLLFSSAFMSARDYSRVTSALVSYPSWRLDDLPLSRGDSHTVSRRIECLFPNHQPKFVKNGTSCVIKSVDMFGCRTTSELESYLRHQPIP